MKDINDLIANLKLLKEQSKDRQLTNVELKRWNQLYDLILDAVQLMRSVIVPGQVKSQNFNRRSTYTKLAKFDKTGTFRILPPTPAVTPFFPKRQSEDQNDELYQSKRHKINNALLNDLPLLENLNNIRRLDHQNNN